MSWVRIPLGTQKGRSSGRPFLCPVGFGPRVRHRRSRLSDSERIPLGTQKGRSSGRPFFVSGGVRTHWGPSAVLQGKCARSPQKRGYRERFSGKTARGTFMLNSFGDITSLYHRQGLLHRRDRELYMNDL